MPRVEYLHTSGGGPMSLPFDLPPGRLPVILPRPKVRSRKLLDGALIHEAHNVRHLHLQSDRGLFEIGFMLEFRQFAALSAAELFTIRSLARCLTFSDKLVFPDLRDTGQLLFVENSDNSYVWATIPETVVVTSHFTALDLRDQGMALDEPDVLREAIERAVLSCPDADVDEMLKRFGKFKRPHITNIRRCAVERRRLLAACRT